MANLQTLTSTTPVQDHSAPAEQAQYLTPAADILENEDSYLVLADMPGVTAENVAIELEANVLSIEGKTTSLDGAALIFHREFKVGSGVDPEGVSAELRQGVLYLNAKKSAARKPRKIAVNVG